MSSFYSLPPQASLAYLRCLIQWAQIASFFIDPSFEWTAFNWDNVGSWNQLQKFLCAAARPARVRGSQTRESSDGVTQRNVPTFAARLNPPGSQWNFFVVELLLYFAVIVFAIALGCDGV